MGDTALIQVDGLTRRYGATRAVDGVSFTLQPGDVLGFLGPNGAGKTSTMRVLTGNLAPTAGRVWINGVDLLDEPQRAKAHIGYLPEHPPVYPDLTVDEYLRYCARLNRIPRREVGDAVAKAKARCGIADIGGRVIGNLSRGYQQRVGIAQAIIHMPAVVVLDEPTIGLDPLQVREIRELIGELGREHGVILSTHILPEVQAVCNRVQIIHDGRLVFSESMDALNARMTPTSLWAEFARPPGTDALAALPGVTDVEPLDGGRVRIRHETGRSPAETLAERAVANGWGLRALVPEARTLEQMFVELTLSESGASAGDDTEDSRAEAA